MFTVLDWIIVGVAVVAFVIGIIKGLFRQLFALGGILLVFKCGSLLTPYAQEWLSSLIPDDSVRSLVALLASYIVLFVVWALISGIILKILEKSKALGGINRIMGGVLGIAIVYVCCAVLFALVLKTSDTFMPWLKNIMKPLIEGENPSWIVTNGVERRWTERDGICRVVTDYAHHPTEIAAAVATAKSMAKHTVCVFQPHTFSRTKAFMVQFAECFSGVSVVYLPVFAARESPIDGVDSVALCRIARSLGIDAYYAADFAEAAATATKLVTSRRDILLLLGAGNVCDMAEMFCK